MTGRDFGNPSSDEILSQLKDVHRTIGKVR